MRKQRTQRVDDIWKFVFRVWLTLFIKKNISNFNIMFLKPSFFETVQKMVQMWFVYLKV